MVHDFTLTLGAAAARLSSVLTGSGHADLQGAIYLQPDVENSGAIYVGGAGVSSSAFGVQLEPSATVGESTVSLPPFALGQALLSQVYVAGTENDVLHILVVQ